MYTFSHVFVLLAAAEHAAGSTPPSTAAAAASLTQALEGDDACLAGAGCGMALLQTHGLPGRGAAVQRNPTEPAPPVQDDKFKFFLETVPRPWGDAIDAGTGPGSLAFIAACPVSTITAVTGNETNVRTTLEETGQFLDMKLDKVIAGNWKDADFLKDKQYDVVLADWLLGSVEFFAPHFQVGLMRRIHKLVKPGGYLLFTGREPDDFTANRTASARLLLDIDSLRDAAAILAKRRPYREIPQWWVEEEMGALGLNILHKKKFPMDLGLGSYIYTQLEWAGGEISHVPDEHLRAALKARQQALYKTAQETESVWRHAFSGNEYSIVARKP